MSYCRFSSSDFQCDVYCFEHVDGFVVIHVAGRRHILKDLPEPIDPAIDLPGFVKRQRVVMDMLDSNNMEDIDLPHAGAAFKCKSFQEAADKLKELKALGYRIPDYAITGLEADAKEEADA